MTSLEAALFYFISWFILSYIIVHEIKRHKKKQEQEPVLDIKKTILVYAVVGFILFALYSMRDKEDPFNLDRPGLTDAPAVEETIDQNQGN